MNHYLAEILAESYRGKLLSEILAMEKKKPISFQEAANLAGWEAVRTSMSGQVGPEPGQCFWYFKNFVKWISEQGYHIDLTGDEFEPNLVCEHLI